MSFVSVFNQLPIEHLLALAQNASDSQAAGALANPHGLLRRFAALLSPAADARLEDLSREARHLTRQRFGKTIRFFAPLYVSNECINNCKYCGFSRDNPILRVTLSLDDVIREARALQEQGFRNLLLVAGEHPKFVSSEYLGDCVRMLHEEIRKAMASPDIGKRLNTEGAVHWDVSPEEFRKYVVAETARWKSVIESAKIKIE